jgi:hypothetical protein
MTLPTLWRIAALAEQGATVIGMAPEGSPALGDDPAAFATLTARLWGGAEVTRVGAGQVIALRDADAALALAGVAADFRMEGAAADAEVPFVHRTLADGEIWFLANRKDRPERFTARFRVSGKQPELWHADDGRIEPVSYRIEGGETLVPLALDAEDSVFVMFRKPAVAQAVEVKAVVLGPVAPLAGPWTVRFQPGRGAPASAVLPALQPLNENADPAIRYFSGEATYARSFALPKGVKPGQPLWLDLGAVGDIAEVKVNGRTVGYAWHKPFRVDLGKALRKGTNRLEVRVANLWVNRLIGDAQPGARKITWTATPTYKADAPLRPSGLIGPVRLLAPR